MQAIIFEVCEDHNTDKSDCKDNCKSNLTGSEHKNVFSGKNKA